MAPLLTSLEANLVPGSATNATSIEYMATFSEPVTGVDPTDFAVALSGSLGTTLTQIQPVDSSVYKITVSGITGNGTLGLNLVADGSIQDALMNPLSDNFTGQAYTIDHVAPHVQSVDRTSPANTTTNASSVIYTVTFSEGVTGVSSTEFSLASTGTVGSTLMQIQPVTDSIYTVTISGITGNGNLNLRFLLDNDTIHDIANNALRNSNAFTYFRPKQDVATDSQPASAAIGDVDGDGTQDLVTASAGMNTLSILLGNGNGTFQPEQYVGTNAQAIFVTVTDVNGDTTLDLITANYNGNSASILLGNSNGTFQPAQDFPTGSHPYSVAVADVNGDGRPDLVTANYGAPTASVLLGNGDGTFQTKQDVSTADRSIFVVVADVNRDGKPDLVTANPAANAVSVVLGNGDGSFQPKQEVVTGAAPFSVAATDINGDGKPDLVTANFGDSTASVLLGNGDGTFQPKQDFPTGTQPNSVATADVNADGKPDLITANRGDHTVSALLGKGNGTFQVKQDYPTGSFPVSMAMADVNGDGRPDVITASPFFTNASILLGGSNDNIPRQFDTSYTFDHVAPYVISIDSYSPIGPTSTGRSVVYMAVFSESVTGVDVTDFALALTGNVAATITQVEGPTLTYVESRGFVAYGYKVTISGIEGSGTLRLRLSNDGTIRDRVDNSLPGNFAGEVYTIEQVPPFVKSINHTAPFGPSTNASSVKYLVSFSEAVQGVDSTDFALAVTGTVGATITQVQQSSSICFVTVSGISGSGTLGLNLVADGSIRDSVLNPLVGNFAGQVYTIDPDAPLVQSINRTTPAGPSTNADSVSYTVTFSEPVTGVDPADFVLALTGTLGTTPIQIQPVNSSVYTVTISGITGEGTLGLNLVADGSIQDAALNPLSDNLTGQIYTIDRIAPFVQSINRTTPTEPNSNATSVTYTVVFSEPVIGVDPTDFDLALAGTVGATLMQVQRLNDSAYTLTVSGITGDGSFGLNLVANGSIHDAFMNPVSGNFTGEIYTFDTVAPFVQSIDRTSPAGTTTNASSVTYTVTFSEPVTSVDPTDFELLLNGAVVTTLTQVQPVSNSVYKVTISGITGNGSLRLDLTDDSTIRDLVNNPLGQAEGPAAFGSTQVFVADSQLLSVAAADVNGDGKADLVTVNFSANYLSVLLGNGDGTFQPKQDVVTGTQPVSVTVADVNGDGKPDLITANGEGDSASVLLGNGDGTFQLPHDFSTGTRPMSVAVADLNGDGKADLVTANYGARNASVLLGNGDGTFQTKQDVSTAYHPIAVVVADVNGDGKPDLVTVSPAPSTVSVLLGIGDGTFQPKRTFATGLQPNSVAVADINGDGKPDLVTANFGANTASVFLGNGEGTFQPRQDFATGTQPSAVAILDVNRDGKQDLVTANRGGTVSVLSGEGNGTFQATQDFSTGSSQFALAVADLNRDGKPDLVTADAFIRIFSTLLGVGNGDFTGQVYTFDHVAPFVQSINRTNPTDSSTNANNVTYTVTFSEPVTGVDLTDFALARTGTVGVALAEVQSVSSSVYTVTVSGITGSGTLKLNLSGDGSIKDAALNALSNDFTGQTYVIDRSAPTMQLINRMTPSGASTNATSVTYRVLFSESVTGVDSTDFLVAVTGTVNTAFTQVQQSTSSTYFVTISGITGNGTLGLNLVADGSIKDAILNPSTDNFTGQIYTIDQTVPYVQSIDRTSPAGPSTNAGSVSYTVTFNEGVTGVNLSDFALGLTGTVGATLSQVQTVSSSVYTVTITGITGTGTLGLNLVANGSIKDTVLNLLSDNFMGQIYTIEAVPPIVQSIVRGTPADPITHATNVSYTVTFNEGVTGVDLSDFALALTGTVGATLSQVQPISSSVYSVTINGITGSGALGLNLSADGSIRNAHLDTLVDGFTGQLYTIEDATPFVASINRTTPAGSTTSAPSVMYTVTFSEPVTGVDLSDFALALTGNVGATLAQVQPVSGSVYTVTISGIVGNGTLGLNLVADGTIQDAVLAPLSASFTGQIYTIAHAAPVVLSINRTSPAGTTTNAASVTYTVTFSEPVTGVDPTDFVIPNGGVGTTLMQVQPITSSVYKVVVSGITGNGPLALNLVANGSIQGAFSNPLTANFSGQNYTFDHNAPYVQAIVRVSPSGPTTNATSVFYGVVFSETVNGLDLSDFNLTLTGTVGTGSMLLEMFNSTTYLVTINGITGDGTLGLNLIDNGSIIDLANNSLRQASGPSTFQAKQDFVTGDNPYSLAVGDVNGDGIPDLITANSNATTASVLLGIGNGSFQLKQDIDIGVEALSVALADVNGDGKLDLITANYNDSTVSVLLGNGNGTFQPNQDFFSGTGPRSVTVADVNGDGKPDIVTANGSSSNVSVLLGNGDGTFQSKQDFETGDFPIFVSLADVNGDKTPDLVTANTSGGNASVLLGDGHGSFGIHQDFSTGFTKSVTVLDVNGDRKPDLITANSVLLGNGNGTFQPKIDLNLAVSQDYGVAADVNRDGIPDIVTTRAADSTASVLLGNGNGTFMAAQSLAVGSGPGTSKLAVADVNGDGKLDIITANSGPGGPSVSILLANRNGNFAGEIYTIDHAPPVNITVGNVTASEGHGGPTPFVFTVTLSAAAANFLTVKYSTANGTATTVDHDYASTNGSLTFAAGQTTQVVTVLVTGDTAFEPNETFNLKLSGASSNGTITGATGIGTIINDDLPPPGIVSRQVFYNQSKYDGNNALANASDDVAIATDKVALLPGAGKASFNNITSYTRGINGIMVDIQGPHGTLTASDFIFKVGANNTPSLWEPPAGLPSITVRPGAGTGGSDRVEIIFGDNAPKNQWLQVTVKGNDSPGGFNTNTSLAASDIFYFGNRVGDDGSGSVTQAITSLLDENNARLNFGISASITNVWDFDRSGLVSATDSLASRFNAGTLLRISIANPPAAPEAAPTAVMAEAATGDSGIASVLAALSLLNADMRPMSTNDQSQNFNQSGIDLHATPITQLLANSAEDDDPRAQAILKIADHLAHKLDLDEGLLEDLIQDL